MIKKMLFAAAVVAGSFGAAQGATTLFSDTFNGDTLGLGKTSLTNWMATSGTVDVIGTGSFDFYPGNGNYIDMNGNNAARIELKSALNFVIGQTYTIAFKFGYNKNSGTNEQLTFGLGSNVLGTLTSTNFTPTLTNLGTWSYSFTAASSFAAKLFFADTGTTTGDRGGPVIDNVSVTAVPVPAGGLLLISGLGGLATLRRRKLAAKQQA